MKRMYILLSVLSLFIVAGCSDDNDKSPEETLAGEWKLSGWHSDVPMDVDNDGKASKDLYSQYNGCKKFLYFILNDDFTGKIEWDANPINEACIPNRGDYKGQPWRFEKGKDGHSDALVFTMSDYYDFYEIIKLSNTTMVIKESGLLTCCGPGFIGPEYKNTYLKFKRVK